MNSALKFDHEEESRKIILNVLQGLEKNERLLWGHRGFPNLGDYPCMVYLDCHTRHTRGESPQILFVRLDTFESYPMHFRHIITDGISLDPIYRVEWILPGKNNPVKTNFYRTSWEKILHFIRKIERDLDSEVERAHKVHMEAQQRLGEFRRRLPDFREEYSS